MNRSVVRRTTGRLMAAGLVALLTGLTAPAQADRRPPDTIEEGAWWYDAMGIEQAHEKGTGKGVTIALLDGPFDLSVPELQGADIRFGFDCNGRKSRSYTGSGSNHGTAQAVLLVGNGRGDGPGGTGVRGIVPDATVLAYDFDLEPERKRISCSDEARQRMVDDAVRRGADIISVASTFTHGRPEAYERAIAAGVIVVGAAGADDVLNSAVPADLEGAVSVYAVDRDARPWKDQRTSGQPVISAPGVHIGTGAYLSNGEWTSNGWMTGTSPATTITSGSLALVKSAFPEATGNQLLQHMIHYPGGTRKFSWDDEYGFGIVSPVAMLQSDPTQWPDENPLLGKVLGESVTKYPMWVSSLVDDPASASPSPSPSPGASASAAPSDEASPSVEPVASDTGRDDASADRGSGETSPWIWWVVAAVAALAVATVLMTRMRARTAARLQDRTGGE